MRKKVALLTSLVLSCSMLLAACGSQSTSTQGTKKASADANWPKKPIQMIVPFKAGGDTDFNARTYAQYLEKELGQPIVIVNTEGAGGSLAAEQVKNSPSDGYKIFFANTGLLLNEVTGLSNYSFKDAFDTIGIVGQSAGECITVRKDFPANTVPELIELTKKEPNKYKITSVTGGIMHYFAIRLKDAGANLVIVDAGGVNDRIAGLKGKHVDVIVNTIGTVKSYVDSGDFKILAMTCSERSKAFPKIPTCKEQGVDLDIGLQYNMFVKKGTDPAIEKKLADAVKKVSENAEYAKETAKAYDQTPFVLTPEESVKELSDQRDKFMKYKDLFQGNKK